VRGVVIIDGDHVQNQQVLERRVRMAVNFAVALPPKPFEARQPRKAR
jgi:hypothetical protein